jgi:hypothetical protein
MDEPRHETPEAPARTPKPPRPALGAVLLLWAVLAFGYFVAEGGRGTYGAETLGGLVLSVVRLPAVRSLLPGDAGVVLGSALLSLVGAMNGVGRLHRSPFG